MVLVLFAMLLGVKIGRLSFVMLKPEQNVWLLEWAIVFMVRMLQ